MPYKACAGCGTPFRPQHDRQTRCPGCKRPRRERIPFERPSPSTIAGRDPQYRRNRRRILANNPPCHWCGATPATTADHLIPVSRGGTNALHNLVPACRLCNLSRGNRPRPRTPPPTPKATP